MKDLAGAESSARAVLRLKPKEPSSFAGLMRVLQMLPTCPQDAVELRALSEAMDLCVALSEICDRKDSANAEACLEQVRKFGSDLQSKAQIDSRLEQLRRGQTHNVHVK